MHQWASSARLPLTDRTVPVVRRYLTWHLRFLFVGLVAGWILAIVLIARADVPGAGLVQAVVYGPLAAATVASGWVVGRGTRPDGVADLEPRTVDRYLPPPFVWVPRAMVVVVLVVSAWALTTDPVAVSAPGRDAVIVASAAGSIAVLLLGELVERAILRRRRSAGPFDIIAADDAIRSHSVHAVAGATFGALTSLLGPAASRLAAGDTFAAGFETVAQVAPLLGWAMINCFGLLRPGRPMVPPSPPRQPPPPVGPPVPGPPVGAPS